MTQEERDIRRKIKVLEHACSSGNVSKTCRYFGISRETYYCWRRRYQQYGEKGLVNRRPGPRNPLGSIKRYQYTSVDDATRVRALKVYRRHTQANAIKFVDYIQSQFPFRIRMIRTDNGHEFQAQFHWHLKDLGIDHVYIKPHSPRLNGKVERSHRTDETEFYQLLEYKGDVDLETRLSEWQQYYNLHRPHTAHGGRTPF